MNFLDRSGHIFNLPSYPYEPIGHEFEENDYIFWIDNCKMNKLSINNYYVRTIYLVVPFDRIPKYGKLNESDLTDEQMTEIVKNHPMINDSDDINTKFVKRALNGEDVKDEYDKNPDTSKEGILEAIKALELNTEQIKIVGKNIKHDENSFIGE